MVLLLRKLEFARDIVRVLYPNHHNPLDGTLHNPFALEDVVTALKDSDLFNFPCITFKRIKNIHVSHWGTYTSDGSSVSVAIRNGLDRWSDFAAIKELMHLSDVDDECISREKSSFDDFLSHIASVGSISYDGDNLAKISEHSAIIGAIELMLPIEQRDKLIKSNIDIDQISQWCMVPPQYLKIVFNEDIHKILWELIEPENNKIADKSLV